MFPEGCLWFDGALYVSAPPSIWKLKENNANEPERLQWHEGKTLTGCANDLHGPYLGLDGLIYWCKGAFARQTYQTAGRDLIDTRASHIFRAPVDHSDLEPVLTAGMDNPVGVAFRLDGERFMCGTFLMHPEAGKRDGVVHAIYGGVYGKPNDVLEGHPKTGDLMPIMTHLGAAAPCAIIRYESESFGPGYQDNLFVCSFNLHKVTRHILMPDGATFRTIDNDFLVSDNPDFHPTDVIEDADGSLVVIDTGAWYKLCCPTSQLSKPDVLGAIYRIRKSGATATTDPRGLTIQWDTLPALQTARLLDDPRSAVRKRALLQLSKGGAEAAKALTIPLKQFKSPRSRAAVVWGLTRLNVPEARSAVRSALADADAVVKHAAIQSLGLWRDRESIGALLNLLPSADPSLQRVLGEALGRIGDPTAVPALLSAAAQASDRVLEHSLLYALIELRAPKETALGLDATDSKVQRAALIALDQMRGGALQPETVTPFLRSSDAKLRQTALWVAEQHPDWGAALRPYFEMQLREGNFAGRAEEFQAQLTKFSSSLPIQELIAEHLSDRAAPGEVTELLLRTIAGTSLKQAPGPWVKAIHLSLATPNEVVLRAAISAAGSLNQSKSTVEEINTALRQVAEDSARSEDLRLQALSAMSEHAEPLQPASLSLLLANLVPDKSVSLRQSAAAVLARSRLSDQQLAALSERLRTTGPLETTRVLEAFEQSTNSEVGLKLVHDLKACKSRTSLRPETLQRVLAHYPQDVRGDAQDLMNSLQADLPSQRAHLDELMHALGQGDVRRGQLVFNSQKAACSTCHALGYLGGHVGPDLTSIGQVRTERDLLESIIYPSASFVRSFEPYIVRTKSDEEYNGVLRKDSPTEVVLVTGPTAEVKIDRADIVEMRPGTVSVMPAGLEQQLSRQELADLLAFLKATKWGAH